MLEISRIVCAVDFSDTSRRALQYAAATAKWYGSRLTVLHVVPQVMPSGVLPMLAPVPADQLVLDAEARARLTDQTASFVRASMPGAVTPDVLVADAPSVPLEITTQAELLGAGLLVLGTHGRSGYDRFLIGSTAEKVLHTAHMPVMVVPPHGETVSAGDSRFDRVLCAVDFSESSLAALTWAMSMAQEADARLTLLTVLPMVPEPAELWDAGGTMVAQARAADRATALTRLRTLVPEAVRTYCHVETLAEEGKPYEEILRMARSKESDLIVLGTQSHGAVGRLFFGSTAGHVVRAAQCPVLAVPRH